VKKKLCQPFPAEKFESIEMDLKQPRMMSNDHAYKTTNESEMLKPESSMKMIEATTYHYVHKMNSPGIYAAWLWEENINHITCMRRNPVVLCHFKKISKKFFM
jgi:hypothetical protein